jgi:hypothetical protein
VSASRRDARRPAASELDEDDAKALSAVIRRYYPEGDLTLDEDLGPYFNALVASPRLAACAARMGTFVRTAGERPGTYSHVQREFVDQVLAADWKTNVVALRHIPDAISVGVRIDAIRALRAGREQDLTDEERELAAFIRAVISGIVTNEAWERMRDRLGTRGLVEYAGFILWLQWTIRMEQFLGMKEPSDAEVDNLIREYETGERELPDWRVFIR